MSIIFISHKLNEVTEIADRITVLRRGKKIETLPAAGATEESLARLMVGREVLLRVEKSASTPAAPLLEIDDLHVTDDRGIEKVRGLSLEVRGGEIVGLAGVDGNGQTELIDAIAGLQRTDSGRVLVGGEDVTNKSAKHCLDAGLGHIPEDRQRRGLVLDFSLAENLALHDYDSPPASRLGWLFPKRLVAAGAEAARSSSTSAAAARRRGRPALSGGNQQKVVLAREIDRNPSVLIAAQPTRGLDVGAIEFVHRRLVEERDEGRAVLLVSLELDEILSLSDRILVIYEGEIVGEFAPGVSEEELGVAMTGGGRKERREQRASTEKLAVTEARARLLRRAAARSRTRVRAATTPRASPPGSRCSQKAGGIAVPLLTTLLAFFIGGLVVLATTGKNPLTTYKAIFEGSGLNWFLEVGSYEIGIPFTETRVWFPWDTSFDSFAALNLQQTLIAYVPLVLTGLAVAFAFRCGMFNIGGQGQYLVGSIMAVWVGSELPSLPGLLHILVAVVAGAARRGGLGRDRRVPEGDGRSARGDLDDHAQLHRPLGRASSSSGSAARSRTTTRAASPCPSPTTSSTSRS